MISALKGALSGSLETVILGLMKSTAQYDASEIRGSIKVKDVESFSGYQWKDYTALYWTNYKMCFFLQMDLKLGGVHV